MTEAEETGATKEEGVSLKSSLKPEIVVEATKEEIETMIKRTLVELEMITKIISTEDFDLSNKNYDLKFHYRVMTDCVNMLRGMLILSNWH